jgi:hypothetical protein
MATELAHRTPGLCKRFRAEHAIFDYALCGAPMPHEAKAAIAHVAPVGAIPVARRKARAILPRVIGHRLLGHSLMQPATSPKAEQVGN